MRNACAVIRRRWRRNALSTYRRPGEVKLHDRRVSAGETPVVLSKPAEEDVVNTPTRERERWRASNDGRRCSSDVYRAADQAVGRTANKLPLVRTRVARVVAEAPLPVRRGDRVDEYVLLPIDRRSRQTRPVGERDLSDRKLAVRVERGVAVGRALRRRTARVDRDDPRLDVVHVDLVDRGDVVGPGLLRVGHHAHSTGSRSRT